MKKIAFIAFLLAVCVAAGRAQESRQDISLSGTALVEPFIASSTDVQVSSNRGLRGTGQLPVHADALERLRGQLRDYLPEQDPLSISNTNHYLVNTRTQEISGAYVRSFIFNKFNPFVEAGPGALIFLPIRNSGTTSLDVKQQTEIGGLYGARLRL